MAGLAKVIQILGVTTRDVVLLTDVAKAGAAAAIAGVAVGLVRLMVLAAPPLVVMIICGFSFGLVYLSAALTLGIFSERERAFALNQLRRVIGRFSPSVVETVPVQE